MTMTMIHIAGVALLALRLQTIAAGGCGNGLGHRRQCGAHTGNHRVGGDGGCAGQGAMVEAQVVVVRVVQVRERLLQLLQVRLGLAVVALRKKEMRQGAPGNCHESGFFGRDFDFDFVSAKLVVNLPCFFGGFLGVAFLLAL